MAGSHLVSLLDEHFRSFYKGASTPRALATATRFRTLRSRFRDQYTFTETLEPPANVRRRQQHFAQYSIEDAVPQDS